MFILLAVAAFVFTPGGVARYAVPALALWAWRFWQSALRRTSLPAREKVQSRARHIAGSPSKRIGHHQDFLRRRCPIAYGSRANRRKSTRHRGQDHSSVAGLQPDRCRTVGQGGAPGGHGAPGAIAGPRPAPSCGRRNRLAGKKTGATVMKSSTRCVAPLAVLFARGYAGIRPERAIFRTGCGCHRGTRPRGRHHRRQPGHRRPVQNGDERVRTLYRTAVAAGHVPGDGGEARVPRGDPVRPEAGRRSEGALDFVLQVGSVTESINVVSSVAATGPGDVLARTGDREQAHRRSSPERP